MRSSIRFALSVLVLSVAVSASAQMCEACTQCGTKPSRIACLGVPANGPGYQDCMTVGTCNGCMGWSCIGYIRIDPIDRPKVLLAAVVNGRQYVRSDGALRPVVAVALNDSKTDSKADSKADSTSHSNAHSTTVRADR